jgi:hypothetical protein
MTATCKLGIVLALSGLVPLVPGCVQAPPTPSGPVEVGEHPVEPGPEAPHAVKPASSTGLKMLVRWPDGGTRTVHGLPASTVTLRIRVGGADLSPAPVTEVARAANAATASVQLEVPAGKDRTLTVEGLNRNGKVVTFHESSGHTVEAGRFTQVTALMTTRVGTLKGTVVDDETGLPEPYVTIEVGSDSVMTDGSGNFGLADADRGPQTVRLSKLRFTDSTRSVVIGTRQTANLGTVRLQPYHWVAQHSGTTADLFTVLPLSHDVVLAGGKNGTLLKSLDGGRTWTVVPVKIEYHALTEEASYNQDRGVWGYRYFGNRVTRDLKADLLDLKLVRTASKVRTVYAVTSEGAYKFDVDASWGISTWSMIDDPVAPGWYDSQRRYRSSLDGVSLTGAAIISENRFISAGGAILKTTNRFSSFSSYTNPPDTLVSLVGFENDSRVYAAGLQSDWLYAGFDYYERFDTVRASGVRTDVRGYRALLGISASEVLHAGYTDVGGLNRPTIVSTRSYGDSWTRLYQAEIRPTDRSFRAIAPVESGYCAVGTGGEVALNRPGTSTWTRSRVAAPGADQLNLTDVAFLDRQTGWAVGDGGVILRY